jgi:pyruvate/2-oxoglutarate dehydrogenase complex dihydrolipoamide acyltransferase (E2) component
MWQPRSGEWFTSDLFFNLNDERVHAPKPRNPMFIFELPEIGEGVVEGEIVKWLAQEGEYIQVDQPLCEIMTDKANVEISSPKAGLVKALHGNPGDIIPVHSPLVDIDTDAAQSAGAQPVAKPAPKAAAPPPVAPSPPAVTPAAAPSPTMAAVKTPAVAGKTLATPAVRSHARETRVDINTVSGSGKDGRVIKSDIDAHVAHPSALKAPPALVFKPVEGQGYPRADETVKIIGLRRKIATKMTESYRTIPHFTYVEDIDVTRLVNLRDALKDEAAARGVKLTYLAFILKALASVFREYPTINANMNESDLSVIVRGEINIGIATDTEAGLYVPVIKNVESKSLLQVAHEVVDITERTRQGKAALADFQGGTFTVTSVGNIGGRFATPIINHPEVAILGVNQIHDRPMVIDGQIVARKMMYLSPSFDHRVIDGAVAARFVRSLKNILEKPEVLLMEGM